MFNVRDGSVNFGATATDPDNSPTYDASPSSSWNYRYEPNQIDPRLENVTSLQLFTGTVSASRKQMMGGSHIQQCLVFDGAMPRRIQTAQEFEYGKATFSTKVEHDAEVLAIIPFYNDKAIGVGQIRHNPESIVVLEYRDTGEIDYVTMKEYFSNHQYFGFKYKNSLAAKQMHGKRYPIAAGTTLQDSPSKRDDGNYCFGTNLNVMFATTAEGAEDGITISDEIVPLFTTRKYEKRTVTYGATHFALNSFGDENNYKPFMDIGEYISPDGKLMVTRSFNDNFSAIEMSGPATREVSATFDKVCYVSPGRGKVVDVRVILDPSRQYNVPGITNTQALKYDTATRVFYRAIYDLYRSLYSKDHPRKYSHAFNNLVKQAYAVTQADKEAKAERVQQIYRGAPMDDVTIEFVIEYEVTPTTGFKFTDLVGGKGVAVRIVPAADMPIDAQGNRVQIIMDSIATVSRQNLSRLYEQFYNACSRDLVKEICNTFAVPFPGTRGQRLALADKMRITDTVKKQTPEVTAMWERFVNYIKIISPMQYEFYLDEAQRGLQHEHLISVMEDNITLVCPTDNDPEYPDVLEALRKDYMPFIGPVTYRGHDGQMVTTIEPILIGEVYFVMLEKTGDDCSAVSSGKLQGIGILAHINNKDKYSSPWREQSIRFWGETETAIGTAYMGGEVMAELHNRNNSIPSHRNGVYNILRANKPTDIDRLVNRGEVGLEGTKPVELVKHLGICAGWEIVYKPYVETDPKPKAMQYVN